MSFQQSSVIYISEKDKCMFGLPIPQQTYTTYYNQQTGTDEEKANKTIKNFFGTGNGKISYCCNQNSVDANKQINKNQFGAKLIKKIYGADGKLSEYQVCSCDLDDAPCVNQCQGFELPTSYDFCKASSQTPENIIRDVNNKNVKRIKTKYTTPDCNEIKQCPSSK